MKATMKNVLSMLLVVTLTASLAIGGTMAYLTMDAGDEKNVFSIGNIDVSLDEEVDIFGEGGEVKETEEGAEYIEVMPGDYLKKEVTVTFPEDFSAESLRGKTAVYTIDVAEIRERVLPEMNEEFFKSLHVADAEELNKQV